LRIRVNEVEGEEEGAVFFRYKLRVKRKVLFSSDTS
jgi:hypothetical protein